MNPPSIAIETSVNTTTLKYDSNGDRYLYLNGALHSAYGPAVVLADGTRKWYQYGKLHRTAGPAIEFANGDRAWFIHGQMVRNGGNSFEYHSALAE